MPTKVYRARMTACVVSICLLFAASLSAALHGKAVQFSVTHHSLSNLEQDETILAGDMRKLRRDLRRDATQPPDRNGTRQDSPRLDQYRCGSQLRRREVLTDARGPRPLSLVHLQMALEKEQCLSSRSKMQCGSISGGKRRARRFAAIDEPRYHSISDHLSGNHGVIRLSPMIPSVVMIESVAHDTARCCHRTQHQQRCQRQFKFFHAGSPHFLSIHPFFNRQHGSCQKIPILIGMLDGAPDEANWICRDSSASASASSKRL